MATHVVFQTPKPVTPDTTFCDLPPALAELLEQVALTTSYPTGAVLFAEAQSPRGVFVVRRGRV